MSNNSSGQRWRCQIVIWSISAVVGITVAMLAVGLLGLWVLIGAAGAIGGTLVTGWLLSALVCTDYDAQLQELRSNADSRDISS